MRKITSTELIVRDILASFVFKGDKENILRKLLKLWRNHNYLFDFYVKNKSIIEKSEYFSYDYEFSDFVKDITSDIEQLETFIKQIDEDKSPQLDNYFKPLSNKEDKIKILSFKKKRCKWLRIYALRVDENLYAITGGAIKITKKMQEHPDTKNELAQLNFARDWLKHQGIIAHESFYSYFNL